MTYVGRMATLCGPMLRRLLVGLILGLLVGASVAAAVIAGLHMTTFLDLGGALLAGVAAAVTGVLTGLVAGKPIWASGARIEAGLKAFFGALISVGLMLALREWASGWIVNLSAVSGGGPAPAGELPAASLPLIGALLGSFFELDNSGGDASERRKAPASPRQRVVADRADGRPQARTTNGQREVGDDEAELLSKSTKR